MSPVHCDRHFKTVCRTPSNRQVDPAGRLLYFAMDKGKIFFQDSSLPELFLQAFQAFLFPCHDHEPGCGSVKPVYDARPENVIEGPEIPEAVQKAVNQRSVPVSRRRMNNDPARLVHNDNMFVFINDSEGNLLGFQIERFRRRKNNSDR